MKNLNVAVRQWEEQIIFLHRIVDGPASQSYGIQVARLAGVPAGVVERAGELLRHLKVQHGETPDHPAFPAPAPPADAWQMSLFTVQETPEALLKVDNRLRDVNPDEISPREAHELLRELQEMCRLASAPGKRGSP